MTVEISSLLYDPHMLDFEQEIPFSETSLENVSDHLGSSVWTCESST